MKIFKEIDGVLYAAFDEGHPTGVMKYRRYTLHKGHRVRDGYGVPAAVVEWARSYGLSVYDHWAKDVQALGWRKVYGLDCYHLTQKEFEDVIPKVNDVTIQRMKKESDQYLL